MIHFTQQQRIFSQVLFHILAHNKATKDVQRNVPFNSNKHIKSQLQLLPFFAFQKNNNYFQNEVLRIRSLLFASCTHENEVYEFISQWHNRVHSFIAFIPLISIIISITILKSKEWAVDSIFGQREFNGNATRFMIMTFDSILELKLSIISNNQFNVE